jgi:beta-lactamase class A
MTLVARFVPVVIALTLLGGCAAGSQPAPAPTRTAASSPTAVSSPAFAQLQQRFNANLGIYALGTGREVAYRADDRFAYDSTYKLLIAGVLLRKDTDAQLAHVVTYTSGDLQSYSPITSQHVGTGMSVSDLIAAALQYSDNTAANLLLAQVGGPDGLRSALRALGDTTTHVDRGEPDVNTSVPGDIRDTSTPRALGTDLRGFVLGNWLTTARREQLTNWLLGNTTGGAYIRAGVPAGWKVADKTGNGDYGSRNDIAVVWPPSGHPVIVSVLTNRNAGKNAASADALIADATKAALAALN